MEVSARVDDKIKYGASIFIKNYDAGILRGTDADGIRHNVPNSQFEKWKINQYGFRQEMFPTEKASGVKRIICMGTSETFGLYEDAGKEWPAQLNQILAPYQRFEVINTSVVGLGLDSFVPYMEKYVFKFKPDVVILYINPYFQFEGESRDKKSISAENTSANSATPKTQGAKGYSLNLRLIPKMKNAVKQIMPPFLLKKYQIWAMAREVQEIEKKQLQGREPQDRVPFDTLESFKADLAQMVELLRERKIEVILSSYPVLISEANNQKYLEIFLDNRRFAVNLSFAGMIEAPIQLNKIVQSVAQELGVVFLDNARSIPQDVKYFGDNVHYTNEGARLVAANFADILLRKYAPELDNTVIRYVRDIRVN
jgi:hypothetical protein